MPRSRKEHQHLYNCLGDVMQKRRKLLNMSQIALGEAAHVDRAFISDLEHGKRNPSFGTVASIAQGLKIKYSRLLHSCEECQERAKRA
jgi:transcriptional regulator with XRE-family HTH domain